MVTVFVCDRGSRSKERIKIQLELPPETLEAYKKKAEGTGYTPKQVMENMLRNWADGIESGT